MEVECDITQGRCAWWEVRMEKLGQSKDEGVLLGTVSKFGLRA
jgi:hypothetical protein